MQMQRRMLLRLSNQCKVCSREPRALRTCADAKHELIITPGWAESMSALRNGEATGEPAKQKHLRPPKCT